MEKFLPITNDDAHFQAITSENDGQLSVDVLETEDEIVVKSTIAGIRPENLEIQLTADILTIRGQRPGEEDAPGTRYYARECYWGDFSRSVILPHQVHSERAKATLAHGLLTIRMPKSSGVENVPINTAN